MSKLTAVLTQVLGTTPLTRRGLLIASGAGVLGATILQGNVVANETNNQEEAIRAWAVLMENLKKDLPKVAKKNPKPLKLTPGVFHVGRVKKPGSESDAKGACLRGWATRRREVSSSHLPRERRAL